MILTSEKSLIIPNSIGDKESPLIRRSFLKILEQFIELHVTSILAFFYESKVVIQVEDSHNQMHHEAHSDIHNVVKDNPFEKFDDDVADDDHVPEPEPNIKELLADPFRLDNFVKDQQ